ncbi:ESPR-type extended signal peptide-containing protein [Dialister succinatiphilus]|uniref:ESPR-type extended signal peptide-containing protein n=1 Tax=Dialister succinatiphilus TaxID=487173 RepID=UPI00402564B2
MNKIYKVIWSKAKHTYVVASEIAKGHTKGETTGRGLKKLAAAMLVAAALLSPNFVWAADMVKVDESAPDTAVEVYTKKGTDTQVNAAKTYTYRKVAAEEKVREAADTELNERITNEANAIHDEIKAGDTALDNRITAVKESLQQEAADTYVSKADAAVQDGAIVKADKTIGENVTNLDAALAKETADRLGADKAQDKVIQQVNQNMVDGFNTINKNMADGFTALNNADLKEAQERAAADTVLDDKITAETSARVVADTKLVEAVNSGLSLSNNNVLQKNTTTIDAQGNVTTSKTDANEMILNKGKDNQITLNEKGIKVGTNSSVMDKDGVYTGGDTYSEAKAALKSDGQIKGANGKFTVDASGNTTVTSLDAGTGTIQTKGDLYAKDATFSGDITAKDATLSGDLSAKDGTFSGDLSAKDGTFSGDVSAKDVTATGTLQGAEVTDGTATLKQGKLTGVKDIKTEALHVNGDANVTGKLTTKDLEVTGEFNANTLKSRLDENNYTEIHGGNVTSKNLKVDKGVIRTSESSFDENGREEYVTDNDSRATVKVGANEISQTLDDKGDNPEKAASRVLSQNTNNKYEITDSVVEGNQSNVENRTADTTDSQISFKDDSGKVLNKSYITQNLKKVLMGVEEGDNKTTIEQDANNITNTAKNGTIKNDAGKLVNTASGTIANMAGNDITNTSTNGNIANTAANGTISNNAKNLTNTASENITNKAENGNISNIASNGTISNEAKTISNKADEALTNDAKTITNTASESVTTQIGDGSEVQSVMNGGGIANKATGKSITNDAATITNTGTTSVTNQVGNNKVLVDTTHVQSAFGDTIYTTWDESGITNNAADKTVATTAKDIKNTATGDISNIASNGTISNEAKTISNKADEALTNDAKTITNTASESVTTQIGDGSEVQSVMNGGGIANKATGKSITNDAATITNTGTTSVTNQVGNNKVLVDTTHVQSAFGDTIYTTWDESGITNNAADKTVATNAKNIQNTATGDITNTASTGTITNDAKTLLNKASDSIIDKVGANVERTMTTKKISESVKDGTKSNSFSKTAEKDINIITDGTTTSTLSQLANSVNTSLKNGTQSLNNTKTVTEDVTKVTDKNTGAFSSSSQKADAMTNTVKNGSKSNTVTETASTSEQKLVSGNIIDILKDAENGYVNTTVSNSDGSSSTGVKQTYTDITNTAKQGTITNEAKNLVNKAEEKLSNSAAEIENTATTSIKDTVGKSTVTTTTDGTTFENTDHNVAIGDGSIKKTTISGNTLETGKATMDYAEVMKDLRVGGTTTTEDLHVTNNATIGGTLDVTGAANFQNKVTVAKDLSVGGDVTADSYKVGDKTYIDKDGINANNQVIRNVGQGDISEGSTDAVSGGQLYETNTRVSGLETRMGTVETKVDKLDNKIDKVGANAAAMANLHPLEFDEDSKWNVAAAVGSSGSETASAVGVFYRPNENVMVNASAAMGTGENMFGGGVSLRLGHGGNKAKEAQMKAAAAENKELRAKVDDLTARMDALLSVLNPNMSKDFPDVPENHWAYEAVSRLAGNGIVEGYEDGKYHGERQMTRYEMAEIIYNALSKGAKAEKKLVEEFRPELQAMAVQKKA